MKNNKIHETEVERYQFDPLTFCPPKLKRIRHCSLTFFGAASLLSGDVQIRKVARYDIIRKQYDIIRWYDIIPDHTGMISYQKTMISYRYDIIPITNDIIPDHTTSV